MTKLVAPDALQANTCGTVCEKYKIGTMLFIRGGLTMKTNRMDPLKDEGGSMGEGNTKHSRFRGSGAKGLVVTGTFGCTSCKDGPRVCA
jgi:hypothetical protein